MWMWIEIGIFCALVSGTYGIDVTDPSIPNLDEFVRRHPELDQVNIWYMPRM